MTADSVYPKEPQAAPGKTYKAADFGRRFFAFFIDGLWWIGLAIFGSHLAKIINMWPYEGTFSLVGLFIGIVLRDAVLGGRSPGRWLTSSRVVRLDSLETLSPAKSTVRNLLAALMLMGPFAIGGLLGVLLGKAGEKAAAGVVLVGLFTVLKAGAGNGGQSWWDQIFGTIVVTQAKPGDTLVSAATPRSAGSAP